MAKISFTEQVSVVTLSGILHENESSLMSDVFKSMAENKINIDMISKVPVSTEKTSIGFTFNDEDMTKMLMILKKQKLTNAPMVSFGNVKVTIKSETMINSPGYASSLFSFLNRNNITPLIITTAIDEIAIVIRADEAVQLNIDKNKEK